MFQRGCVTHADASLSVTQQCIVTVEPLVVVAGLQQGAGLPQLPGTHLTAATAIQHQAGSHLAGWGVCRAGTALGAVLGHCLQETHITHSNYTKQVTAGESIYNNRAQFSNVV